MLALSLTMMEGKLVSWEKAEGNKLSKGESLVVVESDRDVETCYNDYLATIMVKDGIIAPTYFANSSLSSYFSITSCQNGEDCIECGSCSSGGVHAPSVKGREEGGGISLREEFCKGVEGEHGANG
jgi:pyruvate dehydrogenase E2 component (dihydrolipoamide acetyltransferase)